VRSTFCALAFGQSANSRGQIFHVQVHITSFMYVKEVAVVSDVVLTLGKLSAPVARSRKLLLRQERLRQDYGNGGRYNPWSFAFLSLVIVLLYSQKSLPTVFITLVQFPIVRIVCALYILSGHSLQGYLCVIILSRRTGRDGNAFSVSSELKSANCAKKLKREQMQKYA
jgi:hypothetical protein